MSAESEVTRVLSNPDHVILSDALKNRLGDEVETSTNSRDILVTITSSNFSIDAELYSLDINEIRNVVTIAVPSFKAIDAAFSLKQEPIEINFENSDFKIEGKVTSVLIEKELERNTGNFNLTLLVELK
ncbi:MAG: hypothetical protein CL885_04765 [Dehalococcoidia bacterium]|nr:hypothetical protein [Dehalococcoidia bacterium]|tara:strand:- start:940 stop:1326 length:387 start_codon:yes stop_codon:yes gene_type:complete